MTMVSTGPISLGGSATSGGLNQSVNIELGRSATASINMNESAVRSLAGVPSGAISMNNFYGKSSRVVSNITISANTSNYVLNTAKVTGYVAGITDVTLTINSGVFVSSSSTGSYAFTVDTSWNAADTVTIVNNGTIVGRGGDGGSNAGAGGGGGPALNVQRPASINNVNRIAGGGGGGGAGGSAAGFCGKCGNPSAGGGGGGGGIGVSSGGTGVSTGGSGTLTSAGNGGSGSSANTPCAAAFGGTGGNGGGYGSAGSTGGSGSAPVYIPGACTSTFGQAGGSGGSAGAAVVGNSNITWIATGTRNGNIS